QPKLPDSGAGLLSTKQRKSSVTNMGTAVAGEDAGAAQPISDCLMEEPAALAVGPAELRATAQIDRVRGLGYVQAVLWLAGGLADGLAHAHDGGILHQDLKPANILIGDGGEPLLLDFNLATDVKLRQSASAALVGGTLPYMAPEHLHAFWSDNRALDA